MNKNSKIAAAFFCASALVTVCYPQIGNGISIAQSNDTIISNKAVTTANHEHQKNNSNLAVNKTLRETAAAKSIDKTTDAAVDATKIAKTDGKIENPAGAAVYSATAYALHGRTATGAGVRRGIIAADPKHLPLGTRVQLSAGNWSGTYLVADTGGAIRGRKIDVWVPNNSEARKFGRRKVKLTVLSRAR